jgi:hypothetical protein
MNENTLPGVGTARVAEFRKVLKSPNGLQLLPGGVVIDGDYARDPLNTAYLPTLRCGMPLGMISASGLFAPSIIGLSTAAIAGTGTSLTVSAATGVELVRRIGASGTFKLVGPQVAGGRVRSRTLTYSGVVTTTVTVTAPGLAATNCVQTLTPNAAWTAGTLSLGFIHPTTGDLTWLTLTYTTDLATTLAAINVILDAAFGTGAIVATGGGNITSLVFTYSGGVFAGRDHPLPLVSYAGATGAASTTTFTNLGGYSQGFVSGSLIMPTDGSCAPLGILGNEDGLKVTDDDGNNLDVTCDQLIIGGMIDASQIVNYPADATLRVWLKAQLRAKSYAMTFDDDFLP